jgi:hypothetical protein
MTSPEEEDELCRGLPRRGRSTWILARAVSMFVVEDRQFLQCQGQSKSAVKTSGLVHSPENSGLEIIRSAVALLQAVGTLYKTATLRRALTSTSWGSDSKGSQKKMR